MNISDYFYMQSSNISFSCNDLLYRIAKGSTARKQITILLDHLVMFQHILAQMFNFAYDKVNFKLQFLLCSFVVNCFWISNLETERLVFYESAAIS